MGTESRENSSIPVEQKERQEHVSSPAPPHFLLVGMDLQLWKDRLEVGTKFVLILIGVAYSAGFLILNIYSAKFGIGNIGLLRPEYIIIGILWLFLIGVTYGGYIGASSLFTAIIPEIGKIPRAFLRILTTIVFVCISVIVGYATPALCVSALGGGGILSSSNVIVVVDLWFTLFAFFSLKLLYSEASKYFKNPLASSDYRHNLKIFAFAELPFRLILVLLAITAYSIAAFPKLGAEYGGGRPRKVQLFIKQANIDAMKQAGFEFAPDSRSLGTVELISDAPDAYVIKPPNTFGKSISVLRIEKELVDLAFYESN